MMIKRLTILTALILFTFPALGQQTVFSVSSISSLQAISSAAGTTIFTVVVDGTQGTGSAFNWVSGSLPCNAATGGGDGGTSFCTSNGSGGYRTDGYWQRQFYGPYHAAWWGAVPDGATDSTTALQNAGNAATAANQPLELDAGTYVTSACLKWGTFPNTSASQGGLTDIRGQGQSASQILSSNTSDCVIGISNVAWGSIQNLTLGYPAATTITSSDTNAIALEIPSWRRGSIRNVRFTNTYIGLVSNDNSTSCSGAACNLAGTYNITFDTLDFVGYYQGAILLTGSGGNESWTNIRAENVSSGDSYGPVITLNGPIETTWTEINIESTRLHTSAIQVYSDGMIQTFNKLHFESDTPTSSAGAPGNANGLIGLLGNAFVKIDGLSISGSTFSNVNITNGRYAMITTNSYAGGGVDLTNFLWNDSPSEHNTVSGMTTMVLFNSAEASTPSSSYYYLHYYQNLGSNPIAIAAYANMAVSSHKQYLIQNNDKTVPRPLMQTPTQTGTTLVSTCDLNQNIVIWNNSSAATWTLSDTNAYPGCQFTGKFLGAAVNVKDGSGTLLATLPMATPTINWADFVFTGTAFIELRAGPN